MRGIHLVPYTLYTLFLSQKTIIHSHQRLTHTDEGHGKGLGK